MQEVLRQLGQQQNVQSQETPSRQQQSSEPFQHNAVIHRLRQTVAEREARIKELEDQIQQLSVEQESDERQSKTTLCSSGFPPEEGDIDKRITFSGSVSKFGHKLVLPAVGSSIEFKEKETNQEERRTILEKQVESTQIDPK
ncbi:hypothetical protein JOQ06_001363 [Pogonophryne albipinna]|nr:hypothetical protein JOQ06_001363 [Pogonophryne albipinna]